MSVCHDCISLAKLDVVVLHLKVELIIHTYSQYIIKFLIETFPHILRLDIMPFFGVLINSNKGHPV